MSFNVLDGYGNDNNYSEPAIREKWVVEIINEQSPDLIGFQEAAYNAITWKDELQKDLCENGEYNYRALDQEENFALEKMTIAAGLIIFWKADRFELVESGCHQYSYTKEVKPVRYFQWVKLYDRVYDKNIVMTNTHFSLAADTESKAAAEGVMVRNSQANTLYHFWKANVTEDTVLFATGDYNSKNFEDSHKTLQTGKQFLPSFDIAVDFDGNTGTGVDYIYTSPATVTVAKATALSYDFAEKLEDKSLNDTYYRASDHAPIMTWAYYK